MLVIDKDQVENMQKGLPGAPLRWATSTSVTPHIDIDIERATAWQHCTPFNSYRPPVITFEIFTLFNISIASTSCQNYNPQSNPPNGQSYHLPPYHHTTPQEASSSSILPKGTLWKTQNRTENSLPPPRPYSNRSIPCLHNASISLRLPRRAEPASPR